MGPPSSSPARQRSWPGWTAPAVVGLAGFLLVVVAIDPAGDYPNAPEGPGLTVDESFNVEQGVRLVEGLRGWLLGAVSLREIFGDVRDLPNAEFGYHNPDHPPLGRLWLGLWHNAVKSLVPTRNHPGPFITACARVGSAASFALTVFLCGWAAAKWYGPTAGVIASTALLLMPRAFGHAHLAALETCMGLTYLMAVVAVAQMWNAETPPTTRWAVLAGLVLGAALLTKIQGFLLSIPVGIWTLYHWRTRAIRPLVIWGLVGLATFFLFWPWLWMDPIGRFFEFLRGTTVRVTLYVWYFGQRYADRDVPWHYPWVLFLVTVPIGLHLLGCWGFFGRSPRIWRERPTQLVLGAIGFPLVLFSIPRIAVYDGERLFLVVFPLWAIVIGRGGSLAYAWLRQKCSSRIALAVALCVLAGQSWGLIATWPCFLSYYNVAVGGLRGANRFGLEINYWGDALTRDLLERVVDTVPDGAQIDVAPVLHQFQLDEMLKQSPLLRRRGIELHPYSEDAPRHSRYLLIFRRMADLPPLLRQLAANETPALAVRRTGVVLAGLYERHLK